MHSLFCEGWFLIRLVAFAGPCVLAATHANVAFDEEIRSVADLALMPGLVDVETSSSDEESTREPSEA